MKKFIYSILILLALCSCDSVNNFLPNYDVVGMVYGQSPRNDTRFEQSMAYNESHPYLTINVSTDEYKVYFSTDMHVDSTWRNLTKWSTLAQSDTDCEFAIILGDVINAMNNYDHFLAGLAPLTKPYFVTVGNHDLYYGQWEQFQKIFGTSVYYFIAQTPKYKDLYMCLDSGDGTLGRKQMSWMKSELEKASKAGYRHIIVFTHTHIFKRDSSQGHIGNYALEETYEITDALSKYGVDWYVSGHAHSRNITDFKNVKYIIVDTLQDPVEEAAYMVATIGREMQYQFIRIKE